MTSFNHKYLLGFMAQLLHPNAVVDSSYFPAPQPFWDRLVKVSSGQLVLPAIYGSLKRKKLLHHVPDDLVLYLREITELNHKRNINILQQITFLSNIFEKNQINYVFLKGAAMLITKDYDSINERMIGDIDVLVSKKDVFRAQEILLGEGYESINKEFFFFWRRSFRKAKKAFGTNCKS